MEPLHKILFVYQQVSSRPTYCTARTTSSQNILQMVKWAEKITI